jgi:hypothetical protein
VKAGWTQWRNWRLTSPPTLLTLPSLSSPQAADYRAAFEWLVEKHAVLQAREVFAKECVRKWKGLKTTLAAEIVSSWVGVGARAGAGVGAGAGGAVGQ